VLSQDDPINDGIEEPISMSQEKATSLSKQENDADQEDAPFTVARPRRDRSVLKKDEEEREEFEAPTRGRRDRSVLNIEETLNKENQDIVFEGLLERKTNQKVLGKHLWETRYFRLSTHSLSIYVNAKSVLSESIVKLSSIISINRNTKSDGTDLKDKRFDIHLKDKTIHLRTENEVVCKQWIHFVTQQRKKHKQSIRTGLELIESGTMRSGRFRSKGTMEYNQYEEAPKTVNKNKEKGKTSKVASVKRFRRHRTSRSEIEREEVSVYSDGDEESEHKDPEINLDEKKRKKPLEFEGFLLRKIGHKQTEKMGESIYFRLICDQLEFSKIDEYDINENDENAIKEMHSNNIMGSISIEHIKSVKMNEYNPNEFVMAFNEYNPNSDWILRAKQNENEMALEWVAVLQRAQKEAVQIVKSINMKSIKTLDEEKEDEYNEKEEEEVEESEESDSERFGASKNKKRKKLGGSIKALQKMINDETILELETARNNDLNENRSNLVNGFEINSLEQDQEALIEKKQNNRCLCFS